MSRSNDVRGFSLLELLAAVSILLVVGAIAVPAFNNTSAQIKVSSAAREVERELQMARMRAVQSDRAIRVRFNCPAAGQYRIVEVIGSPYAPAAADSDSNATTRCDPVGYPFPDPNRAFFAIPNHDGPVQRLPNRVSFGAVQSLEFWPDGTVHRNTGTLPWTVIETAGVTMTLFDNQHGTEASVPSHLKKSITVNGLGKITLQ